MDHHQNSEWYTYGFAHLAPVKAFNKEWLARTLANVTELGNLSPATRELLARDQDAIAKTREQWTSTWHRDLGDRLRRTGEVAASAYEEVGLKIKRLPLRLQEAFPDPYTNPDLWGLMLDDQDAEDLGVQAGIYLRPSHAYPGLAEHTLCHEMVHPLFSFVPSDHLVHGYEEGVCDILSFLPLVKIFGQRQALELIVSLRIFSTDRLDRIYCDALRRVCVHLLYVGADQWLSLLRTVQDEGRDRFIAIETEILTLFEQRSMKAESLQARGNRRHLSEAGQLLSRLALAVVAKPETYVFSPAAFLVAECAQSGSSITDLKESLGNVLTGEEVDAGIAELSEDYSLIVADNDLITANEATRYLYAGTCRYRSSP